MPLKDVIEAGRLKRLGVIRLGWQEPNASGAGKHAVASDHFVMTDAPFLVPFFGEEPTSLPIYFPYDNFDKNIDASYTIWAGGSESRKGICICQGDGETVQSALPFKVTEKRNGEVGVRRAPGDRLVSWGKAAVDFQWGEHAFKEGDPVPCPGRAQDMYPHCAACKASILLKILIRDVRAARFGYWQISTGSIANYKHFLSVWDSITGGGRVPIPMSEAPFVLSIAPGSTLFQDKKSGMWASREAFYLQLELDPRVAQLEMDGRERRFVALLEGRPDPMSVPQLSAAVEAEFEPSNLDFDGELIEPYDEPTGDPLLDGDTRGHVKDADAREDYKEIQEDESKPPSPAELVPAPNGLTHQNIVEQALALDGYDNPGQVKAALVNVVDKGWMRNTEWSLTAAWSELQVYAAAAKE